MARYVLMIFGFGLVILGAELLVRGASALAKRLKVSELVIGLTVVAFGTSLPELSVNTVASIKGTTGIALGNVIGSNIANILLILGISGLISPLIVTKGTVSTEIPLGLLAALLVGILANDRLIEGSIASGLTRSDGLVFISFFIVFVYYSVGIARQITGLAEHIPRRQYGPTRMFALVAVGLFCLIAGGRWVVDGAIVLAAWLGVNQSVIALTVVAVGTSLPELATSAVAAYRGHSDIAVGNVVGSNIFNIFFVLGISSLIRPIPFEAADNIYVGVLIAANLILFFCMFTGKKRVLDRWEAAILIILYAAYMGFLIVRAGKG
jgi:cation:H+ antiporter